MIVNADRFCAYQKQNEARSAVGWADLQAT
jgi:hypothetical protein